MQNGRPQMTDLRPRLRKSGRRKALLSALAAVFVLALSLFAFRGQIRDLADQITGAEYSGSGVGDTVFVIEPGQDGEDIAQNLVSSGITKTFSATLRKIYAADLLFYPGSYLVPQQISTNLALEIIGDPANIQVEKVTIPEGLRITSVFKLLAEKTGISVSEFKQEASKHTSFGIPKAAPSLEGYLFPATYDFPPNLSARQILEIMVERTKSQLIEDGVAKPSWHKTLTLASIVQSEARLTEDFYKVSRVFQNRISVGMPLQSDATVNYGVGSEDIYTSDAERADPNKYNTYLYPGLPIGPISGSGALAIDAVLKPATGDWLYFCTVNLKTGETVFSTTYSEHLKAVAQWLKWMKENPGWDD